MIPTRRAVVLLLALASAFALAANNAVVAPQSAVSHKSQASIYGVESITVPQMLSYQGKLTDTLGVPVPDGNYALTFRLYTAASGGSAFWTEPQTIMVKSGLFSALLGAVTPISSLPDAGALYLSLQVAAGSELSPRLRIASAAYAFLTARAADADLLQGKDTTALWNAKTLQGKDTAALWNAKTLQGKDTTAFDARYVNEGQASSITSNMIVDGTVAAADLGQMGASAGQVMKWTGSAWAPRNDSVGGGGGSGTVRKVVQATGVVCSPNPITDSGTVRFDSTWGDARFVNEGQANSITGAMIVDGTVSSADIRDTTVNTADLKDAAVSMAKINQAGASSGQAIVWNGSAWAPAVVTAGNSDMVDGYHAGNASGQVAVSNGTVNTNLNADFLDGNHAAAFAPASGSGNYIQNQSSAYQTANWKIVGQGQDSSSTGTALRGISTASNSFGVQGVGTNFPGVSGVSSSTQYSAVEGANNASSSGGLGVGGFGNAAIGVYGYSNSNYGVEGISASSYGMYARSSSSYGAYDSSGSTSGVYGVGSSGVYGKGTSASGVYGTSATSDYAGVYGNSSVTGAGNGFGVYGYSPTYWGGRAAANWAAPELLDTFLSGKC